MSKKHESKGFDGKLSDLKTYLKTTGDRFFDEKSPGLSTDGYLDIRREINKRFIEMVTGGEFKRDKKHGDWKITFKHHIPDTHELAELSQTLQNYINNYEQPMLEAFYETGMMDKHGNVINGSSRAADNADMAIPGSSSGNISSSDRVTFLDDISTKKLTDAILGNVGGGYVNMYLQPSDLVIMADNAKKLRKKDRRKKALIVGGIVIVVMAGVAVGAWLYTKHRRKKEAERLAAELEVSCEDAAMDCENIGDIDDAPVVTL